MDTQSAPALQISSLTKSFGKKEVVHGVDLTIPRGSFYGLVGPNGAGKTTTLSMATGLLRPTSGSAQVLGHDVWQDPQHAKQLIGVLADNLPTFDRLTAREILSYIGLLRGMDRDLIAQRSDDLLDALDLADQNGKYIAEYSAGMTKKILLACALLHGPRLLVLDEPFESVDPVSAHTIRELLRRYTAGGGTVILSSHVMEMVEGLCDHVAIMVDGNVLVSGTTDEVRAGKPLQDRFIELVGVKAQREGGFSWLDS
ncbi:ABC transporter ATP-binding protein [Dermabacteraceae bacterium TAE3-ERU27]|nr:ABC transporter ATP-binding protein [Dermabacteraceae bacterium TAE3-ERU27]